MVGKVLFWKIWIPERTKGLPQTEIPLPKIFEICCYTTFRCWDPSGCINISWLENWPEEVSLKIISLWSQIQSKDNVPRFQLSSTYTQSTISNTVRSKSNNAFLGNLCSKMTQLFSFYNFLKYFKIQKHYPYLSVSLWKKPDEKFSTAKWQS